MLCCAIRSVQAQTRPPEQIVLVIDHDTSLYDRAVKAFSEITVLPNMNRQGLSGARNSGIQAASGEIIAFLDDDATAAPDWLEVLQACYADRSVIGAGGYAAPDWERGRPRWFPEEFDWVVGCSYRGLPPVCSPVRNIIGCNMSFRREVFGTAGLFLETLGRVGSGLQGCEETELCIRARSAVPGSKILHEPAARIMHHVPASRSRWRYFLARCWGEGKSKSQIARFAGFEPGLQTERRYVTRVLPAGVARALRDAILHASPTALLRTAAILSGLAAVTGGYVLGSSRHWLCGRTTAGRRAAEMGGEQS